MSNINIDENKISTALGKLSSKAAPGPDGVPPLCLKHGCGKMLSFITDILRDSFRHGDVPLLLKTTLISTVFKGGDRSLSQSYRPVALASHLSKVFE